MSEARIRSWICSLTIVLTIAATACNDGSDNADEPSAAIFYLNLPDGLNTLDPALMSYRAAIWAGAQLFNGLVQLDLDGRIAPGIAEHWQVDSSGTLWTFHLRGDVAFHESECFGAAGSRNVTAADVKFSIERICNANTNTKGFWVYRERIAGAQEYHRATAAGETSDGLSGIRVIDDLTIEIQLTAPFPPFLTLLTMPYGYIVPREAIERYGRDFDKNPVGTGPFVFEEWIDDVELRLTRNQDYFETDENGNRLPYLDGVHATFVRETKSEFLNFQQGDLDFVSSIDPAFARAVLDDEGKLSADYAHYRLLRSPGNSIEYYGMLLDSDNEAAAALPLAKSKELRQALNYAIDREKIIKYVLHGKGVAAHYGVIPPGMPGFSSELQGYRYDPAKAKALLNAAGFPNGKGIPPLTLQLSMNERTAAVAEAVQQQWRELGIEVELRQVDFPRHLDMVANGKLALWRTSWIGDYPDPENFLALFYAPYKAPQGPNTSHIQLAVLDSLYQAALSPRLQAEERYKLYNRMERIVLDEAPWIFLYYDVNQRLVQPWIDGLYIDNQNRLVLTQVRTSRGRQQ